jgi:hypothetical protein
VTVDEGWFRAADGTWIYWCAPRPPEPGEAIPEPLDISAWPEVEPIDETRCSICGTLPGHKHDLATHVKAGTLNTRARGVVITDGPVPPFPATYEQQ